MGCDLTQTAVAFLPAQTMAIRSITPYSSKRSIASPRACSSVEPILFQSRSTMVPRFSSLPVGVLEIKINLHSVETADPPLLTEGIEPLLLWLTTLQVL